MYGQILHKLERSATGLAMLDLPTELKVKKQDFWKFTAVKP
jgi:hypothetical protein